MNVFFQRVVLARLWLTFVVLAASFLVGALGTVNLVAMLAANVRLLHDYGFMAVVDGGFGNWSSLSSSAS